jgi:hypothetical protein
MTDARYIVSNMFTDWRMPFLGSSAFETLLGLGLILLLFTIQILQYRGIFSVYLGPSGVPAVYRWIGYATMLVLIAWLGVSSEQFIYFQF